MSSTPAVVTPVSVSSSLSPNAPSPPPPGPVSSPSDTGSILTTASTLSTITPVTALAFSQQSSSNKTTMTPSTVNTVAVLPSTVPSLSAVVSSMSTSSRSSTSSSNATRSMTSTSETTFSTAPSASSSTTFQSSTFTSSFTTTLPENTTPLAFLSTSATASDTPLAKSSPLPSDAPSVGADTPLTTVFASTTIFITSTNSQGQLMTGAPPVVTEVIITTGSGGIATTVTQAVVNPTLASNNNTVSESFFSDIGAVVGVFVVVGLACASIMAWILFAIRRRQRVRRIEQDTLAEAAVAAAGLNRTPLDDDDDDSLASPNAHRRFSPQMGQRNSRVLHSSFLPTSPRLPEMLDGPVGGGTNSHLRYPAELRTGTRTEGYAARSISPLPRVEQCIDDLGSSRGCRSSYGHTPTYSAGSFEPLLANYARTMSDRDASGPGLESPPDLSLQPNRYSSESPGNGSRNSLRRQNSSDGSVFRDEEDYTRYVLMVRNVPDDQSQHSL